MTQKAEPMAAPIPSPVVGQAVRGRRAPLELHFYCNSVPFSRETIELKTSLGGSESALVFLARGLVARGHRVAIYTRMAADRRGRPWALQWQDDHGVRWCDHSMLDGMVRARQPDVFVSLRMPQMLQSYLLGDCKLRVEWNEDLLILPGQYLANTWQTDLHAFVSEYHREQYCRELPDIRPQTWVTRNPIDYRGIRNAIRGVERDPNRLIHVSRPERALVHGDRSPLLEVFARLRTIKPELTLGVCRYHSMYEENPAVDAVCRRADDLVVQAEGVEWLGELEKDALYREIARASLMVYPGVRDFAETGCIAATEAQACETPMVCTRIGALPETLSPAGGVCIDGDSETEEYQTAFVEACRRLLDDRFAHHVMGRTGRDFAKAYDLHQVAQEWEERIYQAFDERYEANKVGVFRRLMWHDDIRAARLIAAEVPGGLERIEALNADTPESPEEYARRAMGPDEELAEGGRWPLLEPVLARIFPGGLGNVKHILDFAAGNGAYAAGFLRRFPNAHIDVVDYSAELCAVATEFLSRIDEGAYVDRFSVICGSLDAIPRDDYDFIFAGEIVEHFEAPGAFLSALEAHARPGEAGLSGGHMLLTCPQGPWSSWMHGNSTDWSRHARGHKIAFDGRDFDDMLHTRPGYALLHAPLQFGPRNELLGHYIVHWQRGDGLINERDDERKLRRTRPMATLAVCMIVRDAENDVVRALKSVDAIADEVWVADTGSTDRTMELCAPYVRNGGEVWQIGTCPDVPAWAPPPGDFGWARNESISKTTADWILWLDADEILQHAAVVRSYLLDNAFNGYVIPQCHLTMDTMTQDMLDERVPYRHDKPIRLFRRIPQGKQAGVTYQCHSMIHEHFQAGVNDLIAPTMQLGDCRLAHTGYLHEGLRRGKCEHRNIPLLALDRQKYPDRRLAPLLVAREYANISKWERAEIGEHGGPLQQTVPGLMTALEILRTGTDGIGVNHGPFFDPADEYFEASLEVYQDVLHLLGAGQDYAVVILVGNTMVPKTYRLLNDEDYVTLQSHTATALRAQRRTPPISWAEDGTGEPLAETRALEHAVAGMPEFVAPLTATGELGLSQPEV